MAMDNDRVKGSATRTGGTIKQAAGDLTGDTKLRIEGKMDQAKGTARTPWAASKTRSRRSKPLRHDIYRPTDHTVPMGRAAR